MRNLVCANSRKLNRAQVQLTDHQKFYFFVAGVGERYAPNPEKYMHIANPPLLQTQRGYYRHAAQKWMDDALLYRNNQPEQPPLKSKFSLNQEELFLTTSFMIVQIPKKLIGVRWFFTLKIKLNMN